MVLPCRVEIPDRALLAQLDGIPVGGEVRARIHGGTRSLVYVWFGGLLEFFHERIWF